MYRTDFWTLWEKARVGCFERTASKHVYYLGWNRSPAQVGCMRQVLGAGALGRPRGIRWRGRWERGSGWGIHINPWLIHVNVWLKPLQYCKVISLQLIKINEGKKKRERERDNQRLGKSWEEARIPSTVRPQTRPALPAVNFFFTQALLNLVLFTYNEIKSSQSICELKKVKKYHHSRALSFLSSLTTSCVV